MPDKEWTDTEWLDAGWVDMERRLDEVMPVTDRRRRALIWWWSGGLALLLLLGLGWWLRVSTPEIGYFPLPAPELEQAQVAAPPVNQSTADQPEVRPQKAPANETMAMNSKTAPTSGRRETQVSSRRNQSDRSGSEPLLPKIAVAIPAVKEPAKPLPTEEKEETETTATPPRSEPAFQTETARLDMDASPRDPLWITPFLLKSPDLLRVRSQSESPFEKAIVPVRAGRWHFGTEATASTDGVGANGTSLGVLLRRSGDSRWSVDLGLRYHYWEQTWGMDQSLGGAFTEDAQSPDTSALWIDPSISVYRVAQPGGETYRILVAQDPAENPRVRTHWLEFPVHLNYRIGRRWEATLGLRPALLLNSQISVPAVAESAMTQFSNPASIPLSNETMDQLTNAGSRGIVGPSGRILRRGHLGWEAGVNYHLSPHWTVGVQYRRGQNVWQRDSELRSRTGLVGLRLAHWW